MPPLALYSDEPQARLLFRKSLPRSTVERGTLYFWEHAMFHMLDDFAKVPGHIRMDNLAKHSLAIQVTAEGRTFNAKYMKRYNQSNGPFRAFEIKEMIRALRIHENDKIVAYVKKNGDLFCEVIRDLCILCGQETYSRTGVVTMSCTRKGCSTSCHARCSGLNPGAGQQWYCPDHLNAVLGLGGSRHTKAAHAAATRNAAAKSRYAPAEGTRRGAQSTADMAAMALVHLSSHHSSPAAEQQEPSSLHQAPAAHEVVVNSDDVGNVEQRACEPAQAASQSQQQQKQEKAQQQLHYQPSPASSGPNDNSNHSSGTQPTGYSAGDAAPKGADTLKQRKRKFEEVQAGDGFAGVLYATLQRRVQQLEVQRASLEAELQMERRARQTAEQALDTLRGQTVAAYAC